ncbi:uncharacterized protein LOC114157624 isoform X5 [Xiphophorus couchianus]|uniref:uncharacterized protein LOC114157624 isoform X5 n=1 Tax=Xiphophorus couchianus TaxID=32473 RepID=UPI001016D111|nr:uncharacterized protein LOC114157624 isoform X5 [Xiphophorus couchianus]
MPIKICSLCFNIVVVLIFLLGFTTKQVSPVRLTVSPSRSQFFIRESVTLICEDGNRPDGWTVRRNTSRGTRTRCEVWGKLNGSTCNMNYLVPLDTGLYWCESMSGSSSSSSSIQLSVSGGSVILQSPVLPVMEGDDVTLSCRAKNPTHNLPAAFYKDGSFIGDGPSGHMTLLHVSSTDEGLYKCNVKGHGESPSSRISVKGQRKPEDEAKDEKEITYSDLKTFRNQPIRSSRDPALVYSAVRTGDIEYGQINIRETGNQQRSREMDPGPVYSAVRTAGIRPNRTREPEPEPEPDVVYSAVRPADGP